MSLQTDFLVLGSGIAGLSFALRAAEFGEVVVVTKRALNQSATEWAQGGVAAVLDPADSYEEHARDTHVAGAGLCRDTTVDLCVRKGPEVLRWLMDLGASFSVNDSGELDLGREGGHNARRVVHAGDVTGAEISRALVAAVREHPNIRWIEWKMGVDLIVHSRLGKPDQCVGAYVLDERTGTVDTILARATVLATGGAGKVYLYTSNPDVATGDGVAMAYRAGAEVSNMEFFQFHPTVLYEPRAKSFLVSEALRGEGAILRLPDGDAFMPRHHDMADLGPRDVVARAIDYEMKRTGSEHVVLDITHKPASFVRDRFPTIYERCKQYGIDITQEPIPVVPAAHFMCGGVTSDEWGRTTVPGLWVVGETACTGLHGANRLASNSLLEGLVFAERAAEKLRNQLDELRGKPWPDVPEWQIGSACPSDEAVIVTQNWDEIRRLMWNYVGIVRSDSRLMRAHRRIRLLEQEIMDYYWKHLVTRDLLELRNIQCVADLVISSAQSRKESRGLHFTIDHPDKNDALRRDTVLKRGVSAQLRSS
ncbi:MAG TPA: L-aspartate oxidase [Polyangiaceae bacterium]|nr:L-aspartate oxidase [Polyangiaceae bacterium]